MRFTHSPHPQLRRYTHKASGLLPFLVVAFNAFTGFTGLMGVGAAMAADAPAPKSTAPASGLHPLAGTWSWNSFGSKCVETYQYRSTNTMLATSSEALAEWNYTVTPNANDKGFYEVVETSMRHNGKKDCAGDTVDATGIVNIRFIQFSPARDQMIICKEPSLAACFGPLKRQP